jgi:ankyrin repeat protein
VPVHPLPEDPSLENLRKRAKSLLRAVRAGEPRAVAAFRELHPRAETALARSALADAQLVLARSFGFASWARLRRHLGVVESHLWDPPPPLDPVALAAAHPADAFLRLACLAYGSWHPTWPARAERLLAGRPDLAGASLHAAAAAGDVDAARAWLDREPVLLEKKGGALGWEPLLYACYSRLAPGSGRSTLDVARLLLSRGADPDAGFLWRGNVPPFTALTGAFGEGEEGHNQPPHPERDALARALLEAGADPNDEQTLYNRHFGPDDGHLVLLFEYGLGRERTGRWRRLLGDRLHGPRQALVEELWAAARRGFADRVELLLDHGVDPNACGWRDGRTPYEAALASGHREIAAQLASRGARHVEQTPEEAFAAACVAGDGEAVRALLAGDPELGERPGPDGRAALVARAVEARRPAGVRLMAALGFELSRPGRRCTRPPGSGTWS